MVCCLDGGFRRAWSSLDGMLGSFIVRWARLMVFFGPMPVSFAACPIAWAGCFAVLREFHLPGRLCGV